jgi:hypothetical protein|tara:strand:+ start:429 stop:665 length:237 start_codon:yes stop_codon:yes gene_type:complete
MENEFGMSSKAGNRKVMAVMMAASEDFKFDSHVDAWSFVEAKMDEMAQDKMFEEAKDSKVRDQCFSFMFEGNEEGDAE